MCVYAATVLACLLCLRLLRRRLLSQHRRLACPGSRRLVAWRRAGPRDALRRTLLRLVLGRLEPSLCRSGAGGAGSVLIIAAGMDLVRTALLRCKGAPQGELDIPHLRFKLRILDLGIAAEWLRDHVRDGSARTYNSTAHTHGIER